MDLKAALVSLERKPSSSQVRLQVDGLLFRTFPSHQVIDAQAKTLLTHPQVECGIADWWTTGRKADQKQKGLCSPPGFSWGFFLLLM